ncbi:MAG: hypothetical protein IJL89_05770 [Firmicutes bacterium]|nr:hypothetical protein [Bacillota bacterium]
MFIIESPNKEDCKTLIHSENVFHDALNGGEQRYHVKDTENGNYDLVYIENESLNPILPAFKNMRRIPDYLTYNENETESLLFKLFAKYAVLSCEEVNEYTVTLSRVLIRELNYTVYFTDKSVLRFIKNDKVHITDNLPEGENVFYIQTQWRNGLRDGIFGRLSAPYAFSNMFLLQYLLDGRKIGDIKYICFRLPETGGIGAVLEYANRFAAAFGELGIKLILNDNKVGKFKREMLEKYFNISAPAEDADESNTIFIREDMTVQVINSYFIQSHPSGIDKNILNENFRLEMDEYFDAVFGGKKVLGVLIRGSDYITAGLSGVRKQATADEMIPEIDRWLEEDNYDLIFLATEDSDILNRMYSKYGSKLKAISQERFSVKDFNDSKLIYEYEKKKSRGEEYNISVEDTTINYFYALYLLSKCDSFICSGQCNGYFVVLAFNGGKFKKQYKFNVGGDKK